jgi:hypothetical protein
VSAGGPPREPPEPGSVPGDDEYARGYTEGYEEGLREALREFLQHASRGHTAQELRFLVESRLARLSEDVERKRRSLLAPPRKPAWGPLLRAPRPWDGSAPFGAPPPPAVMALRPGETVLIREERPERAIELLRASAPHYPRVVLVSNRPPEIGSPAGPSPIVLRVGPAAGDAERGLAPGEIAGRIREATDADGGALVYLDAFELLATEYSLDTAVKFVHWTAGQASDRRSALLASVDPKALDPKDLGRLQRAFNIVR